MATIAPWRSHVNVNLLDHPVASEALAPSTVAQLCRQAGHRWRRSFWSPRTTLVTFLLQVLDRAKTLRAAVALLLAQLAGRGVRDLPCGDPTAYCQARMRLPLEVVTGLLRQVADQMRHLVTSWTGRPGRRVWVVDGSSATMSDTPELQDAFPQSPDAVRKEIVMHLLAYNLIRLLMWQAARRHRRDLHRLSFTATLDRLRAMLPHMMT